MLTTRDADGLLVVCKGLGTRGKRDQRRREQLMHQRLPVVVAGLPCLDNADELGVVFAAANRVCVVAQLVHPAAGKARMRNQSVRQIRKRITWLLNAIKLEVGGHTLLRRVGLQVIRKRVRLAEKLPHRI